MCCVLCVVCCIDTGSNPWDVNDLADAFQIALKMDISERKAHQQFAYNYVLQHTAQNWAHSFLSTLNSAAPKQRGLTVPPKLDFNTVRTVFAASKHRLIICGLVGTLTPKRIPKTNPRAIQQLTSNPLTANMILPLSLAAGTGTGTGTSSGGGGGGGAGGGDSGGTGLGGAAAASIQVSGADPKVRTPNHHTGSSTPTNAHHNHNHFTHVYTKTSGTIQNSIRRLAADPNTTVVVLTSRGRELCESLLGDSSAAGVWIAAENGYYLRRGVSAGTGTGSGGTPQWHTMFDNVDMSWMAEVRSVFQYFTERTPKSFIEERDTYIAWHYRDCEEEFGESQAHDLMTHLVSGPLANTSTQVINHSRIVQVRPTGVSKGFIAERIVNELETTRQKPLDFILCLGNFLQHDEDVFTVLTDPELSQLSRLAPTPTPNPHDPHDPHDLPSQSPASASSVGDYKRSGSFASSAGGVERTVFTVTVGKKQSRAAACIPTVNESEKLFQQLALSLPTPTPSAAPSPHHHLQPATTPSAGSAAAGTGTGTGTGPSPRATTTTTTAAGSGSGAKQSISLAAWADSRTIY